MGVIPLGVRARAWLDRSLDEFPVIADGESLPLAVKRIGELALVASLLVEAGDARARTYLDLCWRFFDHGPALARVIAAQPAFASIYPAFHRQGLRSDEVERAIAAAVPAITDPSLRLLQASALAWCGLSSPWDLDALLATDWLASAPDPRAAYVATHVVLFLAPIGRLPAHHRRAIDDALPAWTAHFARAGDLDLVGELVMTAHVLGRCVPASDWSILGDAQEDDGLVPFRAAWRGRALPPRVRFRASYHSTLVALAAAALCHAGHNARSREGSDPVYNP